MKYKTGATVHVCDGCQRSTIQLDLEPLPTGQYLTVMSVNGDKVESGLIFTCRPDCIIPAYTALTKTWEQQHK